MKISQTTLDAIKVGGSLAVTAIGAIAKITATKTDDNVVAVLGGIERVIDAFTSGVSGNQSEDQAAAEIRAAATDLDARINNDLRAELAARHGAPPVDGKPR